MSTTSIQQDKELRDLLDVLDGPPGWLADMERILSARDKEIERKARLDGRRIQAEATLDKWKLTKDGEFAIFLEGQIAAHRYELEELSS